MTCRFVSVEVRTLSPDTLVIAGPLDPAALKAMTIVGFVALLKLPVIARSVCGIAVAVVWIWYAETNPSDVDPTSAVSVNPEACATLVQLLLDLPIHRTVSLFAVGVRAGRRISVCDESADTFETSTIEAMAVVS